MRARRLFAVATGVLLPLPLVLSAQSTRESPDATFWIGAGVLIAGAVATDGALQRYSLQHRSHTLDHMSAVGDGLGVARHLIPAMATTYVGARLARRPRLARTVLRTAVAYSASDIVESVLKPVVGRHRPEGTDDPWRFHPFNAHGAWQSFPSAHVAHAISIATAVADAANRPWVTAGVYSLATLVAWSRVYRNQHWGSDVTATAALSIATSHAALRWVRHRMGDYRD